MKKIYEIPRQRILLGPVEAVYSPEIQKICRRPYCDHLRGCPNYGKRADCPPSALFFSDVFEKEVYVAAIVFDFEKYLFHKRQIHPSWSERALRNPRHWQGHLRSELRNFVGEIAQKEKLNGEIIFNPETMGVNVTKTCLEVGLKLEWPPEKKVSCVALIGKKRSKGACGCGQ